MLQQHYLARQCAAPFEGVVKVIMLVTRCLTQTHRVCGGGVCSWCAKGLQKSLEQHHHAVLDAHLCPSLTLAPPLLGQYRNMTSRGLSNAGCRTAHYMPDTVPAVFTHKVKEQLQTIRGQPEQQQNSSGHTSGHQAAGQQQVSESVV